MGDGGEWFCIRSGSIFEGTATRNCIAIRCKRGRQQVMSNQKKHWKETKGVGWDRQYERDMSTF